MDEKYVNKNEVKPYKLFFYKLMKKVRPELKTHGIKYSYNLVGSAKRNLVVRHHNKGFDCDYQIFITKNKNNLKERELKDLIIRIINKYLDNTDFSKCENKTTAITIKKKDYDKSKIIFSYDIVIMKIVDGVTYVIKENDEDKHTYHWAMLKDMSGFNENYKKITGSKMWNDLRNEYYILKTDLNDDRKSFQKLNEAVNRVLNNI